MTPARPPRSRRGAERRETRWRAVLDAAAAEFAERGYHGTSTGAIARRLGLKQGSLYYYIPSKARALELVCQLSTEAMLGGLSEIAARNGDAREKLRRAIAFHVDWLARSHDYCWTFLRERKHVTGAAGRLLAETARRYEKLFQSIIREGIAAGAFRADAKPALSAFATLAAINAFTLRARRHRRLMGPRLADWIAEMTLNGLVRRRDGTRVGRPALERGRAAR